MLNGVPADSVCSDFADYVDVEEVRAFETTRETRVRVYVLEAAACVICLLLMCVMTASYVCVMTASYVLCLLLICVVSASHVCCVCFSCVMCFSCVLRLLINSHTLPDVHQHCGKERLSLGERVGRADSICLDGAATRWTHTHTKHTHTHTHTPPRHTKLHLVPGEREEAA